MGELISGSDTQDGRRREGGETGDAYLEKVKGRRTEVTVTNGT